MPGETPETKKSQQSDAAPGDQMATLIQATAALVVVLSISLSLYQLYTAGIAALTALVQRSIHLGAILSLTFLLKPPFKGARKDKVSAFDCLP